MRLIVLFLVVANLFFWAWRRADLNQSASPDAKRLEQQIAAEQLQVLARDPLNVQTAAPAVTLDPTRSATSIAGVCRIWTALSLEDAHRIELLLAEYYPDLQQQKRLLPPTPAWQIALLPQITAADAEQQGAKLRRLGNYDFIMVEEENAERFKVVFGVFPTETAAYAQLELLRGQGLVNAQISRRSLTKVTALLQIVGPLNQIENAVKVIQHMLPALRAHVCIP